MNITKEQDESEKLLEQIMNNDFLSIEDIQELSKILIDGSTENQ